jgi:hypothetical protein
VWEEIAQNRSQLGEQQERKECLEDQLASWAWGDLARQEGQARRRLDEAEGCVGQAQLGLGQGPHGLVVR